MNALLRKEVRLLLPSFAAALLLSLCVWLLPNRPAYNSEWRTFLTIFPLLLCPAMAVMLALDSFGREISSGTFPNLLAQPVARHKIWWTKVSLLAAALLTVMGVWIVSFRLHMWPYAVNNLQPDHVAVWRSIMLTVPPMFIVVVFSGGLWTVLWLRQVAAAFWFTLIAPGAILLLVLNLTENRPALFPPVSIGALLLYSVGGFVLARSLFLRAQDLQPTGGSLALPSWLKCGRTGADTARVVEQVPSPVAIPDNWQARRQWRPRAALWRKDVQLHQSQFVLAGVLLLLHIGVIVTRPLVEENKSPALHFIMLTFWVLWLFMPLLIGCTAVAEERKVGTLEGQLCLPVTRGRQFAIKLVSTLLLSVLCGAVMPMLLERANISPEVPPPHLAGIAAGIGLIAFYASSLTRNTLQSLAPGVLGVLVVFTAANMAAHRQDLFGLPLWPWPLVYVLAAPAFGVALVGLMYWNFKRVLVGGTVWRRNALVLLLTLLAVTTATATLYHRAWELLKDLEPPHGPPVAGIDERTTMRMEGWRPLVQLPDGRVWAAHLRRWGDGDGLIEELGGAFLDGTNWLKVVSTQRDIMGLQNDGSLWVTEESEKWTQPGPTATRHSKRMIRVGTDRDWTNAIAYQNLSVLLLKSDGSLWELGPQKWTPNQSQISLRGHLPQRLGTESNWTALSVLAGRIFLSQRDGGVWVSPRHSSTDTNTLPLRPGLTLFRAPEFHPTDPYSLWVHWDRGTAQIGVLPDGTLRVTGGPQFQPRREGEKPDWRGFYAPLGTNHGWRGLAGGHRQVPVTIKTDRTLWRWEFPGDLITNPGSAVATRLSKHSDWVAISEGWNGVLALASDGSLWQWRLENPYDHPSQRALLRTSRRPQRLGNIIETAKQ